MKNKLNALETMQTIVEARRDQQSQVLEQHQQQANHYQEQIKTLTHLHSNISGDDLIKNNQTMCSTLLDNRCQVKQMLSKLISHHQIEKDLLDAECERAKRDLQSQHAHVKMLENVANKWHQKIQREEIRQEEKRVEDLINARIRVMI